MTYTFSLPAPQDLPRLPPNEQVRILDTLFEPSLPLHRLALPTFSSNPASYTALIDSIDSALREVLLQNDLDTLDKILSCHPRLGEKKVDSSQSSKEQANLGSEEEREELRKLNEEYEGVFGRLRFLTFARGRTKGQIMEEMLQRIERNDAGKEREEGIKALCDIARDRASKLPIAPPSHEP